ncbi:hypothetical protein SNEBB_004275 [Seison nebaliae]|nr:hypothetical protein SNEBB_004275 [Seison nebaliae]
MWSKFMRIGQTAVKYTFVVTVTSLELELNDVKCSSHLFSNQENHIEIIWKRNHRRIIAESSLLNGELKECIYCFENFPKIIFETEVTLYKSSSGTNEYSDKIWSLVIEHVNEKRKPIAVGELNLGAIVNKMKELNMKELEDQLNEYESINDIPDDVADRIENSLNNLKDQNISLKSLSSKIKCGNLSYDISYEKIKEGSVFDFISLSSEISEKLDGNQSDYDTTSLNRYQVTDQQTISSYVDKKLDSRSIPKVYDGGSEEVIEDKMGKNSSEINRIAKLKYEIHKRNFISANHPLSVIKPDVSIHSDSGLDVTKLTDDISPHPSSISPNDRPNILNEFNSKYTIESEEISPPTSIDRYNRTTHHHYNNNNNNNIIYNNNIMNNNNNITKDIDEKKKDQHLKEMNSHHQIGINSENHREIDELYAKPYFRFDSLTYTQLRKDKELEVRHRRQLKSLKEKEEELSQELKEVREKGREEKEKIEIYETFKQIRINDVNVEPLILTFNDGLNSNEKNSPSVYLSASEEKKEMNEKLTHEEKEDDESKLLLSFRSLDTENISDFETIYAETSECDSFKVLEKKQKRKEIPKITKRRLAPKPPTPFTPTPSPSPSPATYLRNRLQLPPPTQKTEIVESQKRLTDSHRAQSIASSRNSILNNKLCREPRILRKKMNFDELDSFDERSQNYRALLLEWCKNRTKNRKNILLVDFTNSWHNGLALCAIVLSAHPDLYSYENLKNDEIEENFDLAHQIISKIYRIKINIFDKNGQFSSERLIRLLSELRTSIIMEEEEKKIDKEREKALLQDFPSYINPVLKPSRSPSIQLPKRPAPPPPVPIPPPSVPIESSNTNQTSDTPTILKFPVVPKLSEVYTETIKPEKTSKKKFLYKKVDETNEDISTTTSELVNIWGTVITKVMMLSPKEIRPILQRITLFEDKMEETYQYILDNVRTLNHSDKKKIRNVLAKKFTKKMSSRNIKAYNMISKKAEIEYSKTLKNVIYELESQVTSIRIQLDTTEEEDFSEDKMKRQELMLNETSEMLKAYKDLQHFFSGSS